MWNLQSVSKIIEDKIRRKSYQKHQIKLNNMKAKMKILPPQQPQFVYTKNKQQMARRDRLQEIEKHNQILLTKMDTIMYAQYTTNKLRPQAQQLKTLNKVLMNNKAADVYQQNQRFCQKLLRVGSYYPTQNIVQKTDDLQRIAINISQNARRCKSVANFKSRPLSSNSYATSRFYRSRMTYGQDARRNMQNEARPETAPVKPKIPTQRPYSTGRYNQVQREKEQAQNMQEVQRIQGQYKTSY